MEYRRLGSSDLEVSEVGFGCWEIGGDYGGYDESEVVAAVHRALDLGVTLFDTARAYGFGRSEQLLGRALAGRRHDAVVVTKVGMEPEPDGRLRRDSSRRAIVEGVEASLRFLGTDHVDLLLIHWPDRTRGWEEPMAALASVAEAGKARYVGVSNFRAADLEACAPLAPLVANQVGYNLFDRRWEREMFPTATALGIGVMAYGPLAHGLLTGDWAADARFDVADWRSRGMAFGQPIMSPENLPANLEVVERLRAVASEAGLSLPQLAVAWVLRQPAVGVALTGVRTPGQIEQNVRASGARLAPDVLARVDEVMAGARGGTAEVPA
jgi:aryl-alcohol dehydrogenase-like predicted oxidoreductase